MFFKALAAAPTFPGCFVSIKTNFVFTLVSGLTEDELKDLTALEDINIVITLGRRDFIVRECDM
jgi:hypothetical protein